MVIASLDQISVSSKKNAIIVIAIATISILIGYPQPILDLDFYHLLASEGNGSNRINKNTTPMSLAGVNVVITGSTSGLGLGLTRILYRKFGATVIAIGRSKTKLDKLKKELDGTPLRKKGEGEIIPILCDLEDLSSVQRAAEEIISRFDTIGYLINNAGLHQSTVRDRGATPQGFDVVFGVNYLSHFLLTEKLLPLMNNLSQSRRSTSRIIQVVSVMHSFTSGIDLVPDSPSFSNFSLSSSPENDGIVAKLSPKASRPPESFLQINSAYDNSKLAQIYHMRSLARDLAKSETNLNSKKARSIGDERVSSKVKIVSICPTWVGTSIAGSGLKERLLRIFGYESNGFGLASILYAMFNPNAGHENADGLMNDFVSNCALYRYLSSTWMKYHWVHMTGLKHLYKAITATLVILFQKFFPLVYFTTTSSSSYNENYQDALYEWSKMTVAQWM